MTKKSRGKDTILSYGIFLGSFVHQTQI